MTELLELITTVANIDDRWKCPFEHRPKEHNKKNELYPPPDVNNATKLSAALDTDSKHLENIPIDFTCRNKKYNEEAQFTAHHLIPGNESWPPSKTQLYKWVDKREGHIKGDIGYNVNGAENGVDLPGHSAAPSWTDQQFQTKYAFACMEADRKNRQFHDRHPAYSDFVVNVLNKIAAKLDKGTPTPGCGKKNCGGGGEKPYDPPYELNKRLACVAERLESHLVGSWKKWRKPVMTSRFALMYKDNLTQKEAREQLRVANFRAS